MQECWVSNVSSYAVSPRLSCISSRLRFISCRNSFLGRLRLHIEFWIKMNIALLWRDRLMVDLLFWLGPWYKWSTLFSTLDILHLVPHHNHLELLVHYEVTLEDELLFAFVQLTFSTLELSDSQHFALFFRGLLQLLHVHEGLIHELVFSAARSKLLKVGQIHLFLGLTQQKWLLKSLINFGLFHFLFLLSLSSNNCSFANLIQSCIF